jgi:subtilisin family serine protease
MARQSGFSRRLLTALAAASLLTTMGLAAGPANASPGSPGGDAQPANTTPHGSLAGTLDMSKGYASSPYAQRAAAANAAAKLHLRGDGSQTVFVQLAPANSRDGAAAIFHRSYQQRLAQNLKSLPGKPTPKQRKAAAASATTAATKAANARKATILSTASAVIKQAKNADRKATTLYSVTNALPGVALTANRATLKALAARPDVVKISTIVPKHLLNAHTAQLTRVLNTWQDTGLTGDGVKVGIIDTGIDYTHADFGGVGTVGAYQEAEQNASSKLYQWHENLPTLAKTKIAGGWDFVGDDYDAAPTTATGAPNPNYQPVPHPDPNPLDCNEHGTHVAGTVAGYGETSDGTTFTGDYSTLTAQDLDNMEIGPGMAPGATLYSFKVFGCEGSTDVVIEALDTALDPNGDGDFHDGMNIVNLSLGSDYATVDDPENDVVDALAQNGVLPVIAMGNAGDLTDAGGSPGNAVRALAVASSVDSYQLLSGVQVNEPADVEGTALGQVSVEYDWADNGGDGANVVPLPATGDVVELTQTDNLDGCDPLNAADAAAVEDKIAWLTWDSNDATRRCGSAARSANVKAAGAIGAIFTGDVPVFTAGISGDPDIPVFQLTLTETRRLQAAANAGTLNITFTSDLLNNQPSDDPSINDLVSSFSSRGTHGSLGVVKPDVTAPGDTITSAGMGTGDGVLVISGTSMATPHTAGIAALVKAEHPDWTTEQLKAAIMNTATHDLYTGASKTGDIYGPARVGSGRVDALDATTTSVLAYSSDNVGGVSASFGVVEAPAGQTVTEQRHVTVRNTGDNQVTLNLAYSPAIKEPGVSYSLSTDTVHLAGGAQQDVTVTLTADAGALRHTIDPTMAVDQSGVPRQFVTDASGWLTVSQAGRDDLRVPVYGAVKPVSSVSAAPGQAGGETAVTLSGTGFDQGDPTKPTAWSSLVSVMQFGAESPKQTECFGGSGVGCTMNQTAVAGDIQYVGAGVSPDSSGAVADGWLWFGISTYGDWATIGNSTVPYVDFDTTGDGVPDYEVYAQNVTGTDVLVAWLIDINAGAAIDAEPVNMNFGDVDTNVFDSNVLLLPVWPRLIGLTGKGSFPISYTVGTNSYYTNNPNEDIDDVGPVTFDAGKPKVAVDGPLWLDDGGNAVPVTVSKKFTKVLVFHLHNASGTRAQKLLVSPFHGFSDLKTSNVFYDDIAWLVASGISNGKTVDDYGVADSLSRGQMAAFLYRYLHPGKGDASCSGKVRTFSDVPAASPFCGDIEWLADQGIVKGDTSGAFSPGAPVTRQAMAMFIYRTITGLDDVACSGADSDRTFSDVPTGNIACGDIEWLERNGVVNGFGDDTYRPANEVTRSQVAGFLHRAFELGQA